MSESLADHGSTGQGGLSVASPQRLAGLGARRKLQLALAVLWLFDAMLQYQSVMFTRAFGRMLAVTAVGNPTAVAVPITWSARIVEAHPAGADAAFATVQLLLALGIAWRPTTRVALAASIAWALGVWWLGEGLGGVATATPNPVSGAPGAAILYALLAAAVWPADRAGSPPPFLAARSVGALPARLLWLLLWGGLAWFAVQPASRTPQGLHDTITRMAAAQPRWLSWLDHGAAGLLADRGTQASIVLAALLAVIAAAVWCPAPLARAGLALTIAVAAALWVVGEDFGGVFTRAATDPGSGPLLALLAVAYWPRPITGPGPAGGPA